MEKPFAFSTLDENSGYWLDDSGEEAENTTAFTLQQRLYFFVRMSYAVRNVSSMFP